MRRLLFASAVAAISLGLGAAHAEPATPEGAKAMADAYAAYFSTAALEKGVLAITPQDEDYVVTWDFAKALSGSGVTVSPFAYRITPTLDGGWLARATNLPTVSYAPAGGPEGGTIAFDGFRFQGLYDPAAPEFFRSKLKLGALRADVKARVGAQILHYVMAETGVASEWRLRTGEEAGAVDVRMTDSVASATEKSSVIGAGAQETPVHESRQGAATSQTVVTGLRAAAFGELWRFLVAHAKSGPPSGEALKPKIAALAPLWKEMSGRVEVSDVAVPFPGGSQSNKSAEAELKMSGLAPHATAALALAVKDLTFDLEAAPDWFRSLWPVTAVLQIEASMDGLDRAADIALADPEWIKSGALGEQAKDAIKQTLEDSHPRMVLSKTRISTPLVEATFAGEAQLEGSIPQAHAQITADNLDKLMEAIAKIAESEPEARQFLYLATFLRGLAKFEDGRLVWDLDFVAPNAVKVNGQLFPPQ